MSRKMKQRSVGAIVGMLVVAAAIFVGCSQQEKHHAMKMPVREAEEAAQSAARSDRPRATSPEARTGRVFQQPVGTNSNIELAIREQSVDPKNASKSLTPVDGNNTVLPQIKEAEKELEASSSRAEPGQLQQPEIRITPVYPADKNQDSLRLKSPDSSVSRAPRRHDHDAQNVLGKSKAMNQVESKVPPVPASSLPAASDELWIISKPAKAQAVPANNDDGQPRSGALVVVKDQKLIPCPLQHTDVKARVDGFIASVDVTQQYANPFSEKIEATYVFPLPENAAINEFVMTIGDRTIRGIIRDKEEAKQIYEAAKSQGYTASLLQQDRPNVFTQKVANIEPGKRIDISIRYFNTLQYVDGWYEFVFPMVVGPRFNPPGKTDGIGAASRDNAGASGQATEIKYLAPAERSGHDISLEVALNAGVAIEQVESVNHVVESAMVKQVADNPGLKILRIAPNDRIPNKDFVLRYKVAGKQLKQAVFTQADKDGKGGYFALLLVPPETTADLPRRPVELCFTLDVSGSMSGAPMEQSRAAMRYALQNMRPDDSFQVIRFAGGADQLASDALPATPQNVKKGLKYIEQTQAGGGTMMLAGITRALNQTIDEDKVRYVCLLTDGFIGNEAELIKATHQMRGATKVFGFGVGSGPNRYLLDGMSRAGTGAVAYLSLEENGQDVMQPFFERISKPALTNISVSASGLSDAEIYPAKVPDVYVGRAVVITGRYQGDGGSIVVKGRGAGGAVEKRFEIRPSNADTTASLAAVWARQKISSLCDRALIESDETAAPQIKQVALDYSLMSDFTSFVAVDSSHRTDGAHGVSVVQPVPVPDGVRYDTTVQTAGKVGAE